VFLHTFFPFNRDGPHRGVSESVSCGPNAGWEHEPCAAPVALHWQLPVVSFQDAVCLPKARQPFLHWFAGCGELDAPGDECMVHPGPTTHALIALLVEHTLAAGAAQLSAALSGSNATSAQPLDSPAARATLQPEYMVATFEVCTFPGPLLDLSFDHDPANGSLRTSRFSPLPPPRHELSGWHLHDPDSARTGRAAAWACAGPAACVMSFELFLPGWAVNLKPRPGNGARRTVRPPPHPLILRYLRSRHNMGFVRLWLDGDQHLNTTLDGTWQSRSSQQDTAIILLESLCGDSCLRIGERRGPTKHILHIERPLMLQTARHAAGASPPLHTAVQHRFQLSSIRVCANDSHKRFKFETTKYQ